MSVSIEEVQQVASLARLEIADEDLEPMARQLSAILDYVAQLQQINTDEVEPLAHPLDIHNVFRADALTPSLPYAEALANAPVQRNAPVRDGAYFSVPAVLD